MTSSIGPEQASEIYRELCEARATMTEKDSRIKELESRANNQKPLEEVIFMRDERIKELEAELLNVKGCAHLDKPYRRIVEERDRLEAELKDYRAIGNLHYLSELEAHNLKLKSALEKISKQCDYVDDEWACEVLTTIKSMSEEALTEGGV